MSNYGKPKPARQEPEAPPKIVLNNTTLNTPRRRTVDEPVVEHVTVVYPDEHIETQLRGTPKDKVVVGQDIPQKLDPATHHWNDLSSRGEKIQIIHGVEPEPMELAETVDIQISEATITDRQNTMDSAGWGHAVPNDGKKRVIRIG